MALAWEFRALTSGVPATNAGYLERSNRTHYGEEDRLKEDEII